MAATEASAAPVVQEDGKTAESKAAEAEPPANNAHSETVNSEAAPDGTAINSEAAGNDDTAAAAEEEEGGAAAGEEAAPQSAENASSSAEAKTSFLDSFLNKSGLGKVMAGRKKKAGEDGAAEGGEKDGEKGGDEAAAAEAGAEGGAEGEAAENGEKEEEKKAEKSKAADAKSSVRDLIRKPVARIFSHRGADKKDGAAAADTHKPVKVRSRSLDRLADAEVLNAAAADSTAEEGGAAGGAESGAEGGAEGEQKAASSAATKHMKRWHSFKKLMAQKSHKKSGGGDEGTDGEGGGDSSTLDSSGSGQRRWKLKRSWTFQGLKRDPSMVGLSAKAKGPDGAKPEEAAAAEEGGDEAKAEGGAEEAKAEGGEEKEKAEGGEEEKAAAAGGGTVTQHANEIWTSFKKRVIPKSKRANTECAPAGEEDATAGEDGVAEDGKDGKSAKAKRSHFGRAVSLKNFILRKGKSTSVDAGEGAKEGEGEGEEPAEAGEAAEEGGGVDGEAAAPEESADKDSNKDGDKDSDKDGAEKAAAEENGDKAAKEAKEAKEAETSPSETPVTNGENGCSNGTAEENAVHNHQEEETTASSPLKKSKEGGGVKDEANAKIINATAPVNSDKKAGNV
ncbi:unnamed protein product [Ophioblennius macclurei]